jgi:hypothetical protein
VGHVSAVFLFAVFRFYLEPALSNPASGIIGIIKFVLVIGIVATTQWYNVLLPEFTRRRRQSEDHE